jgi:hypothetical protein
MTIFTARLARLSAPALLIIALMCQLLLNPIHASALTGISGTGTIGDPYQITSCDQLGEINNDLNAYYELVNDIDCSQVAAGSLTFPIGAGSSFSGSFDGKWHAITGLSIDMPSANPVGLFAELSGSAAVQKLSVYGDITGSANVGILAGRASDSSYINKVDTHGTVSCTNNCAGIVGTMQDSSNLSSSWSDAAVGGSGYTYGGLVGWVNGTSVNIADVYYSGDVAPTGTAPDNVGGIVGFANHAAITNAYSTGSVDGKLYVGGIVGALLSSTVTNTFTTAEVNGVGMGPVFGDSFSSTTTDNYYYDRYSMPSDGFGSVGVGDTQEFIQNSTSSVFSTWSFAAAWIVEYQGYPALRTGRVPYMLCEAPASTNTTITASCFYEPRGWGIPTWQARYRQQGSGTWIPLTLNDSHKGQVTVSGLQAGTWYDVQFQYTNNHGTSQWGTNQILTTGTAPAVGGQTSSGTTQSAAATIAKPSDKVAATALDDLTNIALENDPIANTEVMSVAKVDSRSDAQPKESTDSPVNKEASKKTNSLAQISLWLAILVAAGIIGRAISSRSRRSKRK